MVVLYVVSIGDSHEESLHVAREGKKREVREGMEGAFQAVYGHWRVLVHVLETRTGIPGPAPVRRSPLGVCSRVVSQRSGLSWKPVSF